MLNHNLVLGKFFSIELTNCGDWLSEGQKSESVIEHPTACVR